MAFSTVLADGSVRWNIDATEISKRIFESVEQTSNYCELLPLLFRFEAKPVTLQEHFAFEPCFYAKRPRKMIKKCARQVGKSFQTALEMLIRGLFTPYWNQLFVTPLQEQVKRFSQQYINVLIQESPVRRMFNRKGSSSRVFSRTLKNGSSMTFSYAMKDANRARGVQANEVVYDEFQMMFREVLYVLQSTMGASPYGEYESYSGTPLSYGNVLNSMWNESTMSEWCIPCMHCGYWNVPSAEHDLFKMIGPARQEINKGGFNRAGQKVKRVPGLLCARCSPRKSEKNFKHIYPEHGRWLHKAPERYSEFLGIHVPQAITPLHAYSRKRWNDLNAKMRAGNEAEIYNELMGEPCDSGFKPLTQVDMQRAACLSHKNDLAAALKVAKSYPGRLAMGIDWGGGGQSGESRTKAAIVGLSVTGRTDVLYGIDFGMTSRVYDEVTALMVLAAKFQVDIIAHDAGGGVGANKEAIMYDTGINPRLIWPMCYTGPMTNAMIKVQASQHEGEPTTFMVDKSRLVTFACQAIKQGHIRFFQYDYVSAIQPGLLNDFLNLTTDINHNPKASDKLFVDKEDKQSDDFVHATCFASIALWSKHHAYPKLSTQLFKDDMFKQLGGEKFIRAARELTPAQIEDLINQLVFNIAT